MKMRMNETVLMNEIFQPLYDKYKKEDFVKDKSGVKMVELIAPKIILDPMQPVLNFGVRKTPIKYANLEIEWYDSMDLSVDKIGEHAQIWKNIADIHGKINSNYGWCIYSSENHYQFDNAIEQLLIDSESRRSCMIYNRPSMQYDYCKDGMNDFICTFATQHFIRNNQLIYIVTMRSQDAIFGFFNDFYWHCIVYERMLKKLQTKYVDLQPGNMIWIANSFHIYERHFDMLNKIIESCNVPMG